MNAAIRQRALELGFDECRFTTAAAPDDAEHFQNWLAAGWQGEMAWIERNASKRLDPQLVLPGARSVICLVANYGTRAESRESKAKKLSQRDDVRPSTLNPQPSTGLGLIARYARFADYHNVLGKRLETLTQYIDGRGAGTQSLWHADTGPVLERDFAQRAGIGFIGKHANVISRRFGNWILLAEIITTLELEPDAPETNRCGRCSCCIAACPTGALTAPFQLDARLCISYLTIELKGAIPVELRPLIGNRIFGCDDCLAACPWNRFAREGKLMKEHARPDLAAADLVELLQLDEAGFKSRFAGTPILRTKRRGLLRNVCVALGNTGDRSVLPALQKATGDAEPLIAGHAQWAVEQIQSREKV